MISHTHMGEELWNLIGLTLFDLRIEGLDDHLAETLRCTHDIRWIHSLICRDQYESLTAMGHCRIGCLIGSDDIILNRLARTILHQRYMLMCSCMVDDVWSVFFKNLEDLTTISNGAD